jgi:hypothetical protein
MGESQQQWLAAGVNRLCGAAMCVRPLLHEHILTCDFDPLKKALELPGWGEHPIATGRPRGHLTSNET